jgi:hypothetical protein
VHCSCSVLGRAKAPGALLCCCSANRNRERSGHTHRKGARSNDAWAALSVRTGHGGLTGEQRHGAGIARRWVRPGPVTEQKERAPHAGGGAAHRRRQTRPENSRRGGGKGASSRESDDRASAAQTSKLGALW